MKENSMEIEQALYDAERRGRDLENLDQEVDKIGEKDEDLTKFVKEKSENLPPHSKELIHLYASLAQEFERQMNNEPFYEDKKTLINAAKNLADIAFQAGEKFVKLFVYEKYEPFMKRFQSVKEQIKAIIADAENLPDDSEKFRHDRKTTYLIQNMQFQYQGLRDITHDMYIESLISKADTNTEALPGQIINKIRESEKESRKK